MKSYRLNIIKNMKRGFLTIPLGLFTFFLIYISLKIEEKSWQLILMTILFCLLGLPGIMIHIYYFVHDVNVGISNNSENDYFEFSRKGQNIKIFRTEIESIEKIHRNARYVIWWGYMMFKIKLKNGNIYSITNLSIEFDDLYQIARIKDRQINIFNKFRIV